MNQRRIEELTLTEIAAEIAERVRAFDGTGGAERMGPWVRVYSRDEDARDPGNVETKLVRADASKYLELLRRGYRVAPAVHHPLTVYRVRYGRMDEAQGYVSMAGARTPAALYQTWHPTRLEAAQEYLTEQTKRLREAQESQAEALELWQREQRAAENGDKSAPEGV